MCIRDSENIVPELTARGYKKAFVCSDPDLIKFGVTKKVTDLLDAANFAYAVYSEIKPNPTIANVQDGDVYKRQHLYPHRECIDQRAHHGASASAGPRPSAACPQGSGRSEEMCIRDRCMGAGVIPDETPIRILYIGHIKYVQWGIFDGNISRNALKKPLKRCV